MHSPSQRGGAPASEERARTLLICATFVQSAELIPMAEDRVIAIIDAYAARVASWRREHQDQRREEPKECDGVSVIHRITSRGQAELELSAGESTFLVD